MAHIIILYASMSGNTEEIVDLLKERLGTSQHNIAVKEIEESEPSDLLSYDVILIGSYTWGDGDLPYETEGFYDDLEEIDLTGKKAAVFGSGDTVYPKFCEAVIIFEERLKGSGAEIVTEGLKIELAPEGEDIERCYAFAEEISRKIEEKHNI